MAKLNDYHKREYVSKEEEERKKDTYRAKCVMFDLSYYDEFNDVLVNSWAPEGCHKTAELEIGEPSTWTWRKDRTGPVYYFCPSCEERWQKKFGVKTIADLMEGL